MKKDYVICVPKLSNSNGVRVLYRLADTLINLGYNVYLFSVPDKNFRYNYITEINEDLRQNAVVVYPEFIIGNPLRFRNVVRYVMYYPNKLMEQNFAENELIFVYERKYLDYGDVLWVSGLDESIFYKDEKTVKDRDCYFVYKGGIWKDIPEFANMTKITRQYPKTRKELGELLRRTKTLYSYDDSSFILEEALLCGCEVKLVKNDGFEDYKSTYGEYLKSGEAQIKNFIEKTQKMSNDNKPKKRNLELVNFSGRYNYFVYKIAYNIFRNFDKKFAQKCWFRAQTRLSRSVKE